MKSYFVSIKGCRINLDNVTHYKPHDITIIRFYFNGGHSKDISFESETERAKALDFLDEWTENHLRFIE